MNIGQVLEVHLGWAARLGSPHRLRCSVKPRRPEIRAALEKIYNGTGPQGKTWGQLSDDGNRASAQELTTTACRLPLLCLTVRLEAEIGDMLQLAFPEDVAKAKAHSRARVPAAQLWRTAAVVMPLSALQRLATCTTWKLHRLLWRTTRRTPASTDRTLLVTQQPLGGKAQPGGQRFGEMEVRGRN
jgi:DNA-directed RNA polymerase subunit beta